MLFPEVPWVFCEGSVLVGGADPISRLGIFTRKFTDLTIIYKEMIDIMYVYIYIYTYICILVGGFNP